MDNMKVRKISKWKTENENLRWPTRVLHVYVQDDLRTIYERMLWRHGKDLSRSGKVITLHV